MKIAVQTIVFNGEKNLPPKMLLAWLEQADAIGDAVFITEGATQARSHNFDGDTSSMTVDGKSVDDTCAIIKEFIKDKPKFHFKEADGFWDGKTKMLNHWFSPDSPMLDFDYVWQIDTDEFYTTKRIKKIKEILEMHRPNRMDFFANHFWGDFDHCMDERCDGIWSQQIPWRRIFKLHKDSVWISHEPPQMNISENFSFSKYETLAMDLKMDHYSYVCREQVEFKSEFYKNPLKLQLFDQWQNDKGMLIFGCPSQPFFGEHCDLIKKYYDL